MLSTLTRRISDDEIDSYQESGVVCLRNIIPAPTVARLRSAIDEAVRTLGNSPAGYDLTRIREAVDKRDIQSLMEESGGQYNVVALAAAAIQTNARMLVDEGHAAEASGRFLLDTGVAARIADFRDISLYGPCPEIAAELMQARKINFYDDQIFVKEAATRERTAYHQDGSYFHLEGDQICTVWIPLDPVDEQSTLRYVRGSHRWKQLFKPNVFVSQMTFPGAQGDTLPDIEANEQDYDIVAFPVEPGDVIVHHHLTVHGAPGNAHPTRGRRAAGIRYCGDDVRFRHRPYAPPQLHHDHDLNDGDPLDCDQFPVVFPRPQRLDEVA